VTSRPATAFLDDTAAVVDAINGCAAELCAELLPNGRRAGNKWMFSGIADTGASESAWCNLSGPKVGRWFDAGNCGHGEDKGDMIDLIRLKLGMDARGAFEDARRRLGMPVSGERAELSQEEKQRRAQEAASAAQARAAQRERADAAERERKAKRAKYLFLGGKPISGTGADAYLRGRGLSPGPSGKWPGSLRFHASVRHGGLEIDLPAMVACIVTREGEHIGTQRIFLSHSREGGWEKLRGAPAKMALGNVWGGFIPINKGSSGKSMADMPEGEPVYVCEGPEDAVAIRMIKPEARIICSINLGNIGAILLPPQATKLVVVADRDEKPEARDALESAIAKQQARGIDVGIVMPPKDVGGVRVKDINDWVLALAKQGVGA
jgi:hypothetical protein